MKKMTVFLTVLVIFSMIFTTFALAYGPSDPPDDPPYEPPEDPPEEPPEDNGIVKGNNGFGNGDQPAPGRSDTHNNAENAQLRRAYPGRSNENGNKDDMTPDVNDD